MNCKVSFYTVSEMIKDNRNDEMLYHDQSSLISTSFMDDVNSDMEEIDINIDDFDDVYTFELNNEQNKKNKTQSYNINEQKTGKIDK